MNSAANPTTNNIHVEQTLSNIAAGATVIGVDTDDDSINAHVVQVVSNVSADSTVIGIVSRTSHER